MRKLILFFLLLAGTAYGQSNNTTNTKFTNGLAAPNGATQKPTSGLTAGALSYVTGAGLYVYNGSAWVLLGLSSGGVTSFNSRTGVVVPEIGDYSSFYVPLTRSLTINGATQTLAADRTWTITALTPNSLTAGYGITGGVFDGSVARTYAADTLSVNGLVSKLRLATNLAGYVKKATTITINGVTQDLSDNRIWAAGTVTSITPGYGLTPQTAITSAGGFGVDTLVLDTVYAKIGDIPSISFGTFGSTPNAQGGSYSGGVITLQPASLTHPGGVTTGEQYFSGQKRFYASGSGHISLNSTSTPRLSLINSLYDLNIGNNGDEINFKYNSYDFILKPASHPASNLTLNLPASSGTLLLDNGSGSGLSGVVLTTTNQSIAGSKTFSDQIVATSGIQTGSTTAFASSYSGTSSNDITLQNAGGQMIVGIDNSTGSVTGGVYNRFISLPTTRNFVIGNAGTNPLTLNGNTGALTITGSISSTPQGTLYGTASGSITSAQLATSLTDETGTGSAVFATSPTLTTPNIGDATGGTYAGTKNQNASSDISISNSDVTNSSSRARFIATSGTVQSVITSINGLGSFMGAASNHSLSLTTNGSSRIAVSPSGAIQFNTYGAGTLTTDASGNITATSDRNAKEKFAPYTKGLSAMEGWKPQTYNWRKETGLDTKERYTSLIAQDVKETVPEAIGKMANGDLTVQERVVIATMVNAINELNIVRKEQQAIIKKQDARILELEKLYLELKK